MKQEWYTRTEWTAAEELEFFRRLGRARKKGQYLAAQAATLAAAGRYEAALKLIECYFEHHREAFWSSGMYLHRAAAYAALGQTEPAIEAFRLSVQAEREFPNFQIHAWLDFAEFVVLRRLTHLYPEIDKLILEFEPQHRPIFPVQRFRLFAIGSELAAATGDESLARKLAGLALHEAGASHSGLSRHPNIGLVSERYRELLDRASKRAAS